jgi:solute carrier family 25 (mitochondrial carnitine/acylcarnitine transporter), member 20/29
MSGTKAFAVPHCATLHISKWPRTLFLIPLLTDRTRVKLPIGLPQPPPHPQIRTETARILNPKSAVPDSAVFVPEKDIRKLSLAADSAFKQLRRSRLTGSAARGEESFTCQSTPCVQLSRTPGFRFVSSFWEDKKPGHSLLEDAYRQNRMSTAAAVRHLQSLHIKAPVIGLIWSDGRVRAHVDWCASEGQEPLVCTVTCPSFSSRMGQLTHRARDIDGPIRFVSGFTS